MDNSKFYREGYRDGLKHALMLARSYSADERIIEKIEKELSKADGENALKLVFGETYLVYEKRNKKGMEIMAEVANQGVFAIILTRDTKNQFKELKNVTHIPITYDELEGSFNPTQLSQMQEFVITNFKDRSVLYIDCIDFIFSTASSVQNVIKFLTVLKDKILDRDGIFILSLNRDTIGKQELSMIEKEFKNTIRIRTD